MTNNLNEKRSYAVIIAAIISTLAVMMCGLISGLVLAVREHRQNDAPDYGRLMAEHLLVDSASSLRSSISALRLCNQPEPAEQINRIALVHAVRAETALECHIDDWVNNRDKEAFLNDIATVLHSYSPEKTIKMSEMLYKYSTEFYTSVSEGTTFEYNGELVGGNEMNEPDKDVTEEDKKQAAELIQTALGADRTESVGAWNGHIEFYIERNGKTGYAVVCNGKIIEYSFMREEGVDDTDIEAAKTAALESAEACGYPDLTVKWAEKTGKSVSVIMCKSYNGALASDDCAMAIVLGDSTVAFNSGGCDHDHTDIPSPKKSEAEARKSAVNGGEGTLVVRKKDGRERICYEYRYDLEDGVHYVYVCAEDGKQMEVI